MNDSPRQITLEEWNARHAELAAAGLREPWYGGPLSRHVAEGGDLRLRHLKYDNSPAALRLWNFLLTEEERLQHARDEGKRLIGAMKDLGTVPVMAAALPNLVAFYPDGAWWIPCVMEMSDGLFRMADSLGIDESFCPVRAMLGAFITRAHFPIPDLLTCSVGATCDDFSAIAQRLNGLGHPILWWEMPHRREMDEYDRAVAKQRKLPDFPLPLDQVEFVMSELERIKSALEDLSGHRLDDETLRAGIKRANRVRNLINMLQRRVYDDWGQLGLIPLPSLEMLIVEMLAIHFCSDREECIAVLEDLVAEVDLRIKRRQSVLPGDPVRVFWVNPVADLRAMNLLEECGGRICGTEYLFSHAIEPLSVRRPPMMSLALAALKDPMVGSAGDRAAHICGTIGTYGAEALIISRIPGASHCATEGRIIREYVQEEYGIPTLEIEVPPLSDAMTPSLRSRIEALVETVKEQRKQYEGKYAR